VRVLFILSLIGAQAVLPPFAGAGIFQQPGLEKVQIRTDPVQRSECVLLLSLFTSNEYFELGSGIGGGTVYRVQSKEGEVLYAEKSYLTRESLENDVRGLELIKRVVAFSKNPRLELEPISIREAVGDRSLRMPYIEGSTVRNVRLGNQEIETQELIDSYFLKQLQELKTDFDAYAAEKLGSDGYEWIKSRLETKADNGVMNIFYFYYKARDKAGTFIKDTHGKDRVFKISIDDMNVLIEKRSGNLFIIDPH
jgi:hypothetical protein